MGNNRYDDSFRTSADIFGNMDGDFSGFDAEYKPEFPENSLKDDNVQSGGKKKDRKNKKKRKKKRRKKHYFLRFIVLVAIIAGLYVFMSSAMFNITDIRVKGNAILSDDKVIGISKIKEGENIFEAGQFKTKKALKKNPYIESVKIEKELPDRITIVVTESEPAAAIEYRGKYIIFNDEGEYIDYAETPVYATVISGIQINKFSKDEGPEFKEPKLFSKSMNLINGFGNADMFLKKVEISASFNIKGYITDTLACSGSVEGILSNMDNLKYMLYDLNQKGVTRGVIRIGEDGYSSFSPVV